MLAAAAGAAAQSTSARCSSPHHVARAPTPLTTPRQTPCACRPGRGHPCTTRDTTNKHPCKRQLPAREHRARIPQERTRIDLLQLAKYSLTKWTLSHCHVTNCTLANHRLPRCTTPQPDAGGRGGACWVMHTGFGKRTRLQFAKVQFAKMPPPRTARR